MTTKPTKAYDTCDVVLVPFPFTDSAQVKKRPAVVLSSDVKFNSPAQACVLAMITSATHSPWPGDVEISDLTQAGLPAKSVIRMKLFTLDKRLILKHLGRLVETDRKALVKSLKIVMPR